MKNTSRCEIPIPPTANKIWRVYQGRQILSADYRSWKEHAALALKLGMKAVKGKVELTIIIQGGAGFMRSRDLDNCAKPVIDAIRHAGMIEGDTVQTVIGVHLLYEECPVKKQPQAKCFVYITPFENGVHNGNGIEAEERNLGTAPTDR